MQRVGIYLRTKQKSSNMSCKIYHFLDKETLCSERVEFDFFILFFFCSMDRTACLCEVSIPVLQSGDGDITGISLLWFLTRSCWGSCRLLSACLVTPVLWELLFSVTLLSLHRTF